MYNDIIEAIIDNISCQSYRLCIVGRPPVPSPKLKFQEINVKGRNGSYYEKYGYEDIEYQLTFNYLEEPETGTFKLQMRKIRHWLYMATRLELSDEPDVFYEVKKVEIGDAENDIVEFGFFDVKFTLAPFAKIIENNPLEYIKTASNLEVIFDNKSIVNSEPKIVIYGTGDCSIYVNGGEAIKFTGINGSIIVDSERKLTYKTDSNGVHMNQSSKQSSNAYPELIPGDNTFMLIGSSITKVEIWRNALV
ncbi:phage tail domain-containing protein [Enterococcus malodoratus]|uniref:phage tail domain-containing protein n=1 Tax=Enterococcus malodoratus TaxID=71451 RepID=UPI00207403C6|nr:phage tail domain-containing protein [Enterococcus malodoratus]